MIDIQAHGRRAAMRNGFADFIWAVNDDFPSIQVGGADRFRKKNIELHEAKPWDEEIPERNRTQMVNNGFYVLIGPTTIERTQPTPWQFFRRDF